MDSIVEHRDHRGLGAEMKLSATVADADVRHLLWLGEHVSGEVLDTVVCTNSYALCRPEGVAVVPAALLGP